jgi:tetratricopeptide (TPR) repeat protein
VWDVHYVIGSGTRGYSYLSDRDGYLFQTPISWYSQKQAWDLSPGFGRSTSTGRAVMADCLFCHANRAGAVEGTVNHYRQPVFDGHAIGCQRCHGPGEVHLAGPGSARGSQGADLTIVNPKWLDPALRDAVCEQCHLQGAGRVLVRGRGLYDFRPGLPLTAFWRVFVRSQAGRGRKAIGQVEQMHESRCFQGSQGTGRLGCVSCHDPHQRVLDEQRVSHYRAACNQCHQSEGCFVPETERRRVSTQDSCIDCHMPRYGAADVPHTATTDHRILRRPESQPAANENPVRADSLPVVPFHTDRADGEDEEDERARAVLVIELALARDPEASRAVRAVLPTLEAACRRDPRDRAAAEARGYALALREQSAEALAVFEDLLKDAPHRELALAGAALAAEDLGQIDAALNYWRRAAAVNPWSPGYRRSLALALVKQEQWEDARSESEAWIRLDPFGAEARATRVKCLLAAGDKEGAREEFARIEALAPPNLPALRIQFAKKLR